MADNSGVRATRLLAVFSTLVVGAGHLIGAAETVVDAKEGNIVLRMGVDGQKKLTNSGRDSKPVGSPDGKWVVFVRSLVGEQIATGSGNYGAEELWQIGIDGKDLIRLVAPKDAENVSDVIATFSDIQFSSDGRLVYFVTPAWATSSAVHVVDSLTTKRC